MRTKVPSSKSSPKNSETEDMFASRLPLRRLVTPGVMSPFSMLTKVVIYGVYPDFCLISFRLSGFEGSRSSFRFLRG